uniref:Uncharacterized protein n=1 Tax=Arundo donax TaxID=35708 RepID=A0A0A9BB56_ARUDO
MVLIRNKFCNDGG